MPSWAWRPESDCDWAYSPHAPRTDVPTRGCHDTLRRGETTSSPVCEARSKRTPGSMAREENRRNRGATYTPSRVLAGDCLTVVVSQTRTRAPFCFSQLPTLLK